MAGSIVHPLAIVDEGAQIGDGTRIWHFCHVMPSARIGKNCVLGQNVFVADGVTIGHGCKIQNNVSIYKGVTLENNVFVGPSAVFTNVLTPRANVGRKDDYKPTLVREGATIGANATIVCGNVIGRYATVGAGAVVVAPVEDQHLVAGVPARSIGRVCICGEVLQPYAFVAVAGFDGKPSGKMSDVKVCPRCYNPSLAI